MEIRKLIITTIVAVIAMTNAAAQNGIDGMMEDYSSHGTSKFTSAVERDPKTRKVLRVVNILELNHIGIDKFISTFRQEARNGNFTEKYDERELTLILTVKGGRKNRIYMMRCSEPYSPGRRNTRYAKATITVIIKYS